MIEEALSIRLSNALFKEAQGSPEGSESSLDKPNRRGSVMSSGFNAIMTAAQRLDSISQGGTSSSVRLPSVTETPSEEPKTEERKEEKAEEKEIMEEYPDEISLDPLTEKVDHE